MKPNEGEPKSKYQDEASEPKANRLKLKEGEPKSKGLYEATLEDLVMKDGSGETGQWLAKITYGSESFDVDSDCLVALHKTPEKPQEIYLRMLPFEWGKTAEQQARNMAVQCMDQAMLMVYDSVQHLGLECIEGQGQTKPDKCAFHVVALKDFSLGQLVLTPYCNKDPESSLLLRKLAHLKKSEDNKNEYIHRMCLSVGTKLENRKKPKSSDGPVFRMNIPFFVQSPLQKLQGQKELDELSPVWVLSKTTIAKDVNMELQTVS